MPINNKRLKVIVLIPAYNTEREICEIFKSLRRLNKYYDEIILCDDGSIDNTLNNALKIRELWELKEKLLIFRHKQNAGYGAAQKTLFKHFLKEEGDIGVLIHSDNQYPPNRIKDLTKPLLTKEADIVLASRFYKNRNYHQEMPLYKVIGNRFLTLIENLIMGTRLSEFHTGLRAYSRDFIEKINFNDYSNKFIFDSEILFDAINKKAIISEVAVFARYEETFSNLKSLTYGIRILIVILKELFRKIFLKKKIEKN